MSSTRITTFAAIAALALASSLASAQMSPTTPQSETQRFNAQEESLQQQSTPMPSASKPVDRTQSPADAVPQAGTRVDRIERFRELEAKMQRESTS